MRERVWAASWQAPCKVGPPLGILRLCEQPPGSLELIMIMIMMSRHGNLACDAIVSGRLHASEVWAASRQPPL